MTEVSKSAIATLDLTEEEAVRDFMIDRIMVDGKMLQVLSVVALVSDRRLADLDGLRLNCLSICRDALSAIACIFENPRNLMNL